jgi:molecular chaperone GrpE
VAGLEPSDGGDPEVQRPTGHHVESETSPSGVVDGPEEEKIAELEDRWRRAVADLANLRRRYDREVARARADERRRILAAWLPILDNLDLALSHADADPRSIVEGVRVVRDQALEALSRSGFERDEETGVPFDPNRHEVVGTVRSPGVRSGTVVEVVRPGYRYGSDLVRPAGVIVATAPEDE